MHESFEVRYLWIPAWHFVCVHAVAIIDVKVIERWIEEENNVIVTGGFQRTSKSHVQ